MGQPNPTEGTSFWGDALAWRGAITPRLLPQIGLFVALAAVAAYAHATWKWDGPDPIHLGYTGGMLAILLVLRTNASYDRWWEARKLWGGIVNQSRNLASKAVAYGGDEAWCRGFVRWTGTFCHAARMSLRGQRDDEAPARLLGAEDAKALRTARHMPLFVATKLARLLAQARKTSGIDGFAFAELDRERALLVDHIGACERILRTPAPRVHTITLRRFILLYLTGVPLALATSSVWIAVTATALISYPLLAIDRIAQELENPFARDRESHLPLDTICARVEGDVIALVPEPEEVDAAADATGDL